MGVCKILLDDRVLIEPVEMADKTISGIIIPDSAKELSQAAKVVQVGMGNENVTMHVAEGDNIIYQKGYGTPLSIDNKKYLVLRQSEIILVV